MTTELKLKDGMGLPTIPVEIEVLDEDGNRLTVKKAQMTEQWTSHYNKRVIFKVVVGTVKRTEDNG